MTKRAILTLGAGLGAAVLSTLLPATATPAGAEAPSTVAQTGRASARADRLGGSMASGAAALSFDGRYIAFESAAADLHPADTSLNRSVFRKDRWTGAVEVVSVRADGASTKDGESVRPAISGDGRFVAFASTSPTLVPGDTNGAADVFVRDLVAGTTERVSVSSAEAQGTGPSSPPNQSAGVDISANGRYVLFGSTAPNLVAGDSNAVNDLFLRDRTLGTTERVSLSALDAQGTGQAVEGTVSDDGRYVAFSTVAPGMVAADDNAFVDVFRRDRTLGTTEWISINSNEGKPNSYSTDPSISANGQRVAFASTASNLVAADTNAKTDVFVRDVLAGTTTRSSTLSAGGQSLGDSSDPAISADGTKVAFTTDGKLEAGDTNAQHDVYLRTASATVRQSLTSAGDQTWFEAFAPALSADGSTTAFTSQGAYSGSDPNATQDVYWHRNLQLGGYATLKGLVQRVHTDFTGAAPAATVDAAVATILDGRSVERLVADLASAPAFGGTRSPVIRLYLAYFQRNPDTAGITHWTTKFAKGTKLDAISQEFAKSSEFTTKYGNTTNATFVTLVYQNVLGRDPEPAGLAYWTKKLDQGMNRGAVMTNFSESSEGQRRLARWSGIVLLTLGAFDRVPTPAEFAGGAQALEGQPLEAGVRYLLALPAFGPNPT